MDFLIKTVGERIIVIEGDYEKKIKNRLKML
jgi:hypothetical protein